MLCLAGIRIRTVTSPTPYQLFWADLFAKRPDLNPPGYNETLKKLGYEVKEPAEDPAKDCDIEF